MTATPAMFKNIKGLKLNIPSDYEDLEENQLIADKVITPKILGNIQGSKPAKPKPNPNSIKQKFSTYRLHRVDETANREAVKKGDLIEVEEHSAGGILYNPEIECIAVISRINRKKIEEWCFPKGHLEDGENPEQAAIREIKEETGISAKINNLLGIVDYDFIVGNYKIHKVVNHYALEKVSGDFKDRVDPDNEVQRILWVPYSKVYDTLSYQNEKKLAKFFLNAISDPVSAPDSSIPIAPIFSLTNK
jgi:8-oxo-dGTP pyrophosphatase MutT (NUDIX family)